ncbi:MAG: hypothetical protein E7Z92_00535 [Cyanobacteria bacterium SIG31]|nr:hypothetical protein [Cyanobacteria bacterium SIG31]
MNFSQRFGLFILIAITVAYVYFSYFNNDFNFSHNNKGTSVYNPLEQAQPKETTEKQEKTTQKNVKIFVIDKNGDLRSVNRICDTNIESSCFNYAIKELIAGPTKWEKSKGFTSEIPQGTKVLSIRESSNSIMIDLSSNFEAGGGAESTYMKVKQIIKTANSNTKIPTYLYINGKQANVIGGEGIMIKQPLNERSFDE